MEKMLILGGKPIGSYELVKRAKELGIYTIVTDYLSKENSIAKQIADECWDISTADIDALSKKIDDENVTSILTGVHEFNIEKKIELCAIKNFEQYCNMNQWKICVNKQSFKNLCQKFEIEVAKTYCENDIKNNIINYPVIVKPEDSSGSRGFSICNNLNELKNGIELAKKYSNEYLIEEYIEHEACIIHYTAINGKLYFSGMSDKHSQILNEKSSVMAIQIFPSSIMDKYLEEINGKAIKMFESIGVENGPIWIEAFKDKNSERLVFNEMGYRLGGSMTNYPVKHFYGIDQLDLMIANACGKNYEYNPKQLYIPTTKKYCILPIHLKSGTINNVLGIDEIEKNPNVNKIVLVHNTGDKIEDWGTAQQVFCYLHIKYNNNEELINCIKDIKNKLIIENEKKENMAYYLFDIEKLNDIFKN